jgi:Ca2+-binding EF-hand superfamily protein
MIKQLLYVCSAVALLTAFSSCQTTTSQTASTPTAEDRFAKADLNHDGKLSPDEASNYFVALIFVSADQNHDGIVTWEEWNVPGSGRTKAKFDAADANHDGRLTLEEALAYGRKRHAFKAEFTEADTNHDGFVTREEAQAFSGSTEGPPR